MVTESLMNTVLVTGANGFVGRALCEALAASGRKLRKAVRAPRAGVAVSGCCRFPAFRLAGILVS